MQTWLTIFSRDIGINLSKACTILYNGYRQMVSVHTLRPMWFQCSDKTETCSKENEG